MLSKLRLRKVVFYDRVNKREFEFLTNLFEMRADLIAALYKIRWQIELLFKQLKQNFPFEILFGRQRKCYQNTDLLRINR